MTKLLGYDYKIEYKNGRDNGVADSLSRRKIIEGECMDISIVQPQWMEELQQSYKGDKTTHEGINECLLQPLNVSLYSYANHILRFKGRLYVGSHTNLREKLVLLMHNSSLGGNYGIQGTYQRIQLTFLWPGMRAFVKEVISQCIVCQ